MFYNMMTGNIQGYEDINSQRQHESSYKFSWDETAVEDLDKKISLYDDNLDDVVEADQSDLNQVAIDTDDVLKETLDIYHGGDQRQRPSSEHSKISSDTNSDTSSELNDNNKDEL